jgi:septum site-determining protein MinC
MTTIRGRGRSLEIAIDRALPTATAEIRAQLEERPAFFRGSRAAVNLGLIEADLAGLVALRDVLAEFGIALDGVSGVESLAPLLAQIDLAYLGATADDEVAAIPRPRAKRNVSLSDGARSLVADFAGARADLAARRTEREAAALERERRASNGAPAPAAPVASAGVTIPDTPQSAPAGISTLYHRGTLRGGQTLHNLGNIVVIGDVNPGAELIASGDILVFGALRGVAHAGAQGDASARVVALELAPTQLRIATMIATSDAGAVDPGPKHAYILGDRIAIVPHAAADLGRREVPV